MDTHHLATEADAIAYLTDRWSDTPASVIDARIQAARAEMVIQHEDPERWWAGIPAGELAAWVLNPTQ